jgi:hypothetical protein
MAFRCLSSASLCVGLSCVSGCGSDGDPSASLAGAGGSAATPSGAGAGGVPASQLPYEPCPAETRIGQFQILLRDGATSIDGQVFDGVEPAIVPGVLESEGSCRLVQLPTLGCNPGCAVSTQTCGPGNECLPRPVAHDVGAVSISGLVRAVDMTASSATSSYRPGPPALPYPGFEPGADLRLSASGGEYGSFELRGWGISPFEAVADPITVSEGQAVHLAWAAPVDPGPARVQVSLDINNHGSSSTSIDCDFPDTGAADIPASLIDALYAKGISGNPTITLGRGTATSASLAPGCVQFLVRSELDLDVTLPGLTSCGESSECPSGQTCNAMQFCE